MAKRKLDGEAQSTTRHHSKRQKIPNEPARPQEKTDIHNARQLKSLLVLHQGDIDATLYGIHTFRNFLNGITDPQNQDDVPRHRAILREYLDLEKPDRSEEKSIYCADIIQTWSFASSSNHDNLFTAVASLFATLVRVLSAHLDLLEHAKGVCKTLLRDEQLRLVSRGVSGPKHKAHIIGPCLRLLTEIVSLDGGALARQLYTRREYTFDAATLARNLHLVETKVEDPSDIVKKPSIRTHTIRYLLANLRFQNDAAKSDMLKQGNVWFSLLSGLSNDYPGLILEILTSLDKYVIADRSILRMQKGHVFNFRSMQTLYEYYKTTNALPEDSTEPDPNRAIFNFLLLACTSPESGLLRPSTGWYTANAEVDGVEQAGSSGSKLEVIAGYDFSSSEAGRMQVRNRVLADFAQLLRPYAINAERNLLMAIFQAAPELVADYFQRKKSFTFEPKITSTWIGYATVLFAVPQLPIPSNLVNNEGRPGPPPSANIVIESILPQPLNARVLTKCLQNSSKVVQLFAVRILSCAFEKLKKVRVAYAQVGDGSPYDWNQGYQNLETIFVQRCPSVGDVIALFRKVGMDELVMREATTRLLILYFDVLPQVALDEKLDISIALTEMLQDLETAQPSPEVRGMKMLQLSNLLRIANWSPAMSWWSKPQTLTYSPFLTLLKIAASQEEDGSSDYRTLLASIVRSAGALKVGPSPNSLDALITSLMGLTAEPNADLWSFLDDCFSRFAKRPIKYQDDMDALEAEAGNIGAEPLSLLVMTLVEQWPYRCKLPKEKLEPLAAWLAGFIAQLIVAKEDVNLVSIIFFRLKDNISDLDVKILFETTYNDTQDAAKMETTVPAPNTAVVHANESTVIIAPSATFDIAQLALPTESKKHPALIRLNNPNIDLDAYIEEGHLSSLTLYLSSTSLPTRLQTLAAVQKFLALLNSQTDHPEKSQLTLLIKELLETYHSYSTADGTQSALPFLTTVLASKIIPVLLNPLHTMYPKINSFLLKGPVWSIERLPSYFVKQILSTRPSDRDDPVAYWREVQWMLEWLGEGIRSPLDITIMRNSNVWERILDLFFDADLARFMRLDLSDAGNDFAMMGPPSGSEARKSPSSSSAKVSPQSTIRSLIVKLVARAAIVDGGADSLVTRNGVLAWIRVVRAEKLVNRQGEKLLVDLERGVLERCEKGHLLSWSSGMLGGGSDANGVDRLGTGTERIEMGSGVVETVA